MFTVLIPFTEKKSLIVIYDKIKELNHVCTTALLFSRRINFPEFLQVTITANSHNWLQQLEPQYTDKKKIVL